jgi:nucleoid-associated protein YgaU
MLTRLSHVFLKVFPAILLVIVALIGALFRRGGGSQKGATTLVPVPAKQTAPPVRRRGPAVALFALLIGIGLILALVGGDGALWRLVSPLPSPNGEGGRPVAALSRPELDAGAGNTSAAFAPGGSATMRTPGEPAVAMAPGARDLNFPFFDIVRVEANGELVVAGRATPNATVELLVDGKPTARAVADANGQFAIVPPALPAGNSEIGLRATDAKGLARPSRDSVAVAVAPSRDAKPLVALTTPDKPTVVLSQPGSSQTATRSVPHATSSRRTTSSSAPPARQDFGDAHSGDVASKAIDASDIARTSRMGSGDGAGARGSDRVTSDGAKSGSSGAPPSQPSEGAVVGTPEGAPTQVVSIDAQEGGRLFVSGRAPPGATVRLYLNDTLIAPARVDRDGKVTFTIGRGVKPGDYKVRLDQVDGASGKVRSRVEVPLSVPEVAGIADTGRLGAASSDAASDRDDGGTVGSNASQPLASPPETVPRHARAGASEGPRDSTSMKPSTMPSLNTVRDPLTPEAVPGAVYVPEVRTARIERGDSLWAISRRTYGDGDRYTAIYDANQDQIRDPDLIYPGQVFVLPSEDAIDTVKDGKSD